MAWVMRRAAASVLSFRGWLLMKRSLIALVKKPGAMVVTPTPWGSSRARRLSP
jgi:hypothetical protein